MAGKQEIKAVIKNGEIGLDLSGFRGKECIRERLGLQAALELLGIETEVLERGDKEEVEEHVSQSQININKINQ